MEGKSGSSGDKLSVKTLANPMGIIVEFLKYQWVYEVTVLERKRIETIISQLRDAGELTTKSMKKCWITCSWVKHMLLVTYLSAFQFGTSSWDMLLLKSLSVLTMAAASCRPGDIARSDNAKAHEFMRIGCLDFRYKATAKSASITDIELEITIEYEKLKKDLPGENRKVFLTVLDDRSNNILDPVLNLMAFFHRRKAFKGATTIEDLLRLAWVDPQKRFQYKESVLNMPLFCGVNNAGYSLALETPATAEFLNNSLKQLAQAAGIEQPVTAREIRNGAARDLAHLSDRSTA